jgi:hypothetical protein
MATLSPWAIPVVLNGVLFVYIISTRTAAIGIKLDQTFSRHTFSLIRIMTGGKKATEMRGLFFFQVMGKRLLLQRLH